MESLIGFNFESQSQKQVDRSKLKTLQGYNSTESSGMLLKFLPELGEGLSKEDAIKNYHNLRPDFLFALHTRLKLYFGNSSKAKDLWKNVLKFWKKPKRYLASMIIINWLIHNYFVNVFNTRSVVKS